MPETPETPLMTPQEVADLFRVDLRTVQNWAADGTLDSVRTPGGRIRFRRAQVAEFLTRQVEFGIPADGNRSHPAG